jgi:hypothetical protein
MTHEHHSRTANVRGRESIWPPIDADQRGLKTLVLSALIGVHRRLKTVTSG